jgi:CRISPR-associated RAMP protein (TIGR02581 family)
MTPPLLDTFRNRLRLEGVLTTVTGLHIGAGGSGDPLGTDLPVVKDAADRPFIPGSSLKGVLRSATEALLRGAPFDSQQWGTDFSCCDVVGGKPCVSHERVKKIREELQKALLPEASGPVPERAVTERVWAESCTVCRLFGSLALAGRVRFADLTLLGDVPPFELRNGVGIDRDKELAAPGVLYDFEAVPPGTSFSLSIVLDNPEDFEVGLLLYLTCELDAGNLALGGKTSRGLGRVRVSWQQVFETRLEQDNPFARLLSTRDLLAAPGKDEGPVVPEPPRRLPDTGDPEAWQALAEVIRELPVIDKAALGQAAAKVGLQKDNLGDRLGLVLDTERRARRAWDLALDSLVASGFLIEQNGRYRLAEREDPPAAGAGSDAPRPPELQNVIDRYLGALARRWQEAC